MLFTKKRRKSRAPSTFQLVCTFTKTVSALGGTNCKRHAYSVTIFRASRDHARDARFNLNVNKLINMRNHAVWIIIRSCSDSTSKAACLFANTKKSTLTTNKKTKKKIKIESQRSISLSIKLQDADQIHSHTWIDSLEEVFFLNFYLVFVIYEITYPNPHPPKKKNPQKDFPLIGIRSHVRFNQNN